MNDARPYQVISAATGEKIAEFDDFAGANDFRKEDIKARLVRMRDGSIYPLPLDAKDLE